MDNNLRTQLLTWLEGIPGIPDDSTHTALLGDLPTIERDHKNAANDLELIVEQLAKMKLVSGEMAISIFIERAARRGPGTIAAIELRKLRDQFRKREHTKIVISSDSFNEWSLDLRSLVEQCLEILLEKQGLVGFAIPCDEPIFQKNFCKRLEQSLGRDVGMVEIKDPVMLRPVLNSSKTAVEKIKKYKDSLKIHDVICSVQTEVFEAGKSDLFWQELSSDFDSLTTNRLIIIMVGSPDCVFPKNCANFLNLTPPVFTKVHIHQWVAEAIDKLKWPSDPVIQTWKKRIFLESMFEGSLNIGFTYMCLERHIRLLQQGLGYEEFICTLEQGS